MPTGKLAVYIPSYNAAETLPLVLDRIPRHLKESAAEILIVDNHSTDGADDVALTYKLSHNLQNLTVIRNPKNLGYGGSQKIAYQYCIEKGYDIVALLHGDAQYAPEFLDPLLEPVSNGHVEMSFGSRMNGAPLKGGMPLHKYLGNRVLTYVQNRLLTTRLSEFHSGFRAYSLDALKKIPFQRLSSDYHFDTEIIILLKQYGLRIGESPIPTHYGDEKSYLNIWRYGVDILTTTFTYFFHRRGWWRSKRWTEILR